MFLCSVFILASPSKMYLGNSDFSSKAVFNAFFFIKLIKNINANED